MHVTMLAAGLLFFWRVFDMRPPRKGASYGTRLMMLWLGTLANIPIGAFTSFKDVVLYPAYDVVGRAFGISAIDDERLGGFIMWAPASMMMLVAVLIVVHAWAGYEEKVEARLEASGSGGTAAAIIRTRAAAGPAPQKNGLFAAGLAAFAACILAATLTIGIIAHHWQSERILAGEGAAAQPRVDVEVGERPGGPLLAAAR
jgi:putative membrane protein